MFLKILSLVFLLFSAQTLFSQDYKVEPINLDGLQKVISDANGKVLVLNFWATWCVPCREEFPELNKLASNYSSVKVVGISMDYPDEVQSKIIPFLNKVKAVFVNYVGKFKNDEQIINYINPKWNGALPFTAIYDKNGKQFAFKEGKISYKELETLIK